MASTFGPWDPSSSTQPLPFPFPLSFKWKCFWIHGRLDKMLMREKIVSYFHCSNAILILLLSTAFMISWMFWTLMPCQMAKLAFLSSLYNSHYKVAAKTILIRVNPFFVVDKAIKTISNSRIWCHRFVCVLLQNHHFSVKMGFWCWAHSNSWFGNFGLSGSPNPT